MRRTFHDQWYRISGLRVGLRPGVSVRLHHYRHEPWYVLYEPAHAGYFRLSPQSWRFVERIDPRSTLDEIWRASVESDPENAPGQEELYELITGLYRANLIFVEGRVDEEKLLDRHQRKKRKPLAARISELLFFRVPLWDPEPWLRRNVGLIEWVYGPWGRGLMLVAVLWALVEFILAGDRIWTQAQEILQLGNLLPLYVTIFLSHALHELSHAALCKYYGGQVRTMGVMLLLFTPLPYVDLSSSWTFRNRWHRAAVDAAGMLADVFTGSVALIVWAYTPPGMVNELAYNLMFTTAVYTVLFNINPLMRFDGYYVLSDLIQVPNLHEQSKTQFNQWFTKTFLKSRPPGEVAVSPRRRWSLIGFFLTSNVYRLAVMMGIVLFVADQYLGMGLVVAAALAFTAFVQPLQKIMAPLKSPLFVHQNRGRLQALALTFLGLAAFLLLVPVPEYRVLNGVVEARADTPVHAEAGGLVREVLAVQGQWVNPGDRLVTLSNPDLAHERAQIEAQIVQTRAQEAKAISEGSVDLMPIRERLATLAAMLAHSLAQIEALTIRAPHAGTWVMKELPYRQDGWVPRGYELGRVVDDREHRFLGVIRQESALTLEAIQTDRTTVRFEGERAFERSVTQITLVPHSRKDLPSAALSPLAGGDQPINVQDPSGTEAVEQFFLLQALILPASVAGAEALPGAQGTVLAGRSGWIRVALADRPLAARGWEWTRQFFQRRYQI